MEICKLDLHVLLFFQPAPKVMLPWLSSLSSRRCDTCESLVDFSARADHEVTAPATGARRSQNSLQETGSRAADRACRRWTYGIPHVVRSYPLDRASGNRHYASTMSWCEARTPSWRKARLSKGIRAQRCSRRSTAKSSRMDRDYRTRSCPQIRSARERSKHPESAQPPPPFCSISKYRDVSL